MSIIDGIVSRVGSDLAIKLIQETDWDEIGFHEGLGADTAVDGSIKVEKRSEAVQDALCIALDKFVKGFRRGVINDREGKNGVESKT